MTTIVKMQIRENFRPGVKAESKVVIIIMNDEDDVIWSDTFSPTFWTSKVSTWNVSLKPLSANEMKTAKFY